MAISITSPTSLLPIQGIRIATASAQIRYQNQDDLVLFELCENTHTAAVFTQNQFCAAPVVVSKQHLHLATTKYLLVNSGNANAGLGEQGLLDAKTTCAELAQAGGCKEVEILPFSTGVIGARLPVESMSRHYPQMLCGLKESGWLDAAKAIMTTDTVSKGLSKQLDLDGHQITLTGISKGAGMICPNMATMLAFVATDLQVDTAALNKILADAVEQSFHCITVDGDTSTNDACVLMATGRASVNYDELSTPARNEFIEGLNALFLHLAQSIIRDGEGVTKFISIKIEQAGNNAMARAIAFTIAHSPLVKTAAFASDPNWGRILAAAGRAGDYQLETSKLSLYINKLQVVAAGELAPGYIEAKGLEQMAKQEIEIHLNLGLGEGLATIWTTDLSHEYVEINSQYRT